MISAGNSVQWTLCGFEKVVVLQTWKHYYKWPLKLETFKVSLFLWLDLLLLYQNPQITCILSSEISQQAILSCLFQEEKGKIWSREMRSREMWRRLEKLAFRMLGEEMRWVSKALNLQFGLHLNLGSVILLAFVCSFTFSLKMGAIKPSSQRY